MKYTLVLQLSGQLAKAVAVEWTVLDAPAPDGTGWEPCIRLADGSWRFASRDGSASQPHLRDPGAFGNIAIRYRLEAAGPWSEISADRKEITIVGEDDGGMLPPVPVLIGGLGLSGSGKIGSPATVEPGQWSGAPSAFAYQWCRDGADIAGATETAYTPVADDDRTDLTCRVAATGAGGRGEAVTAALPVTHVAPTAKGGLFDEVFDQGTGVQLVETAGDFTGEALVFSVEGAGATIDPATGRVGVPTDEPLAGEVVTVTATNSGGAASSAFPVTVEEADDAPVLVALGPDDWKIVEIVEDPVHAGTATVVIETSATGPAADAIALYWSDTSDPQEIGHPTWDLGKVDGRRRFRLRPAWSDANKWHVRAAGESKNNIALRYQLEGEVVGDTHPAAGIAPMTADYQAQFCSPWSLDRKDFTVPADFFGKGDVGSGRAVIKSLAAAAAAAAASTSPESGHSNVYGSQTQGSGGSTNDHLDNLRPFSVALNAHAGNTTYDGRLVAMLKAYLDTGSRTLGLMGGYGFQYEMALLSALVIARHTPRIWSALGAASRSRAELLVETGMYTGAFMCSDTNPYISGSGAQRSLRGSNWTAGGTGRDWNPNYKLPPHLAIGLAVAFFSADGADGKAICQAKCNNYTFSKHLAALSSAGLTETHATYNRTWASAPTSAQIQNTIRTFRRYGVGISGWKHIAITVLNDFCSEKVTTGLNGGAGIGGRGKMIAGQNSMPHPVGTLGMAKEFDSVDAGGKRSAMVYVWLGARAALPPLGAFLVSGVMAKGDPDVKTLFTRMRVCFDDLFHKWTHGYRDYSHGGTKGSDWTMRGTGGSSGDPGKLGKLHCEDSWRVVRDGYFGA